MVLDALITLANLITSDLANMISFIFKRIF